MLGYPFAMGERLTKAMPPAVMGKDIPLDGIFDPTHKRYKRGRGVPRAATRPTPRPRRWSTTARGLEGLKRQWGVHAAGVIMSSEPLVDLIPIMRREQDGQIITQFDYPSCEALGLVKMDFLGLRNLTDPGRRADATSSSTARTGRPRDARRWTTGRPSSCSAAATPSVCSSSTAARCARCCGSMRPDNFEDISAVGALYRPGPDGDELAQRVRRPQERPQAGHADPPRARRSRWREILGETYGLIVYQEQVMAIAQKVAGYSLGAADLLRRAMGKKKKAELDAQFETFEAGMKERGYSAGAVKALWDILLPFSDYAFNKAHSAAYGLVSYWTAYLKANYPAEYMAALLTSVRDDKDKSALYLGECRRMGIKVLPPDVNESRAEFTAVGTDIRFGLAAIRNVGANVVESIADGPRGEGPLHLLQGLPAQGRRASSATSAPSSR